MAEQEIRPFSSSTCEITEIFDEENTHNNNHIDIHKSDDFPLDLLSSHELASNADTRPTVFKNLYSLIAFTLCFFLFIILLVFIILIIYYKPLPPHIHSEISKFSVYNLTNNNINTTLFLKVHNPNPKVDLSIHSVKIDLDFAYSSTTSTHLVPVYLKAQEHKSFQVKIFEENFEIKPKINSDVVSAVINKRYIFSLTIRIKMRVHLNELPFSFPHTIVLNCFVVTYGPTGTLILSSCHE